MRNKQRKLSDIRFFNEINRSLSIHSTRKISSELTPSEIGQTVNEPLKIKGRKGRYIHKRFFLQLKDFQLGYEDCDFVNNLITIKSEYELHSKSGSYEFFADGSFVPLN